MRRRLSALLAMVVMLVTLVAGPAFGQGPSEQASCVGQDVSTFAREIDEISGGQLNNLGEFISTFFAGPGFGQFVSERAQEEERPCPPV